MSQKLQIYQNQNPGFKAHGKYYVRAVYDNKCITTDELAEFIQSQCSVRVSDCKAVLEELGSALKHYLELGQKVRINKVGMFKVGVVSSPSNTLEGCTASNVKSAHVVFSPETVSTPSGKTFPLRRARFTGDEPEVLTYQMKSYNRMPVMIKDIRYELAKDSVSLPPADDNEPSGD